MVKAVKAHVSTDEVVAGRYRLLEVLHRETNRVCWYGEDVAVGRPRLVTRIGLPGDRDGEGSRRATARIMSMAETMGTLCPGRVATVIDAVQDSGVLWVATEWVDGTPLLELLARQGTFTPARAARIGLDILDVLEVAHGEGITHGELSPGQVYVRDQGSVVVTGFGLAGATLAPRVTAPAYASPEQARDERIGPASDLWALGAILYTMLEGRPPFRDRDRPEATLRGVDRLPLRSPVHAGRLAGTVVGLLRKNSSDRLSRAAARDAFTRVLTEEPEHTVGARPRPRGPRSVGAGRGRATMVAGTTLAVVTVSVAVLAVTRQMPDAEDTSANGAPSRPSASAPVTDAQPSLPPEKTPTPPSTPTTSPTPTRSASGDASPGGSRTYRSPEGFSVALPEGWKALRTTRTAGLAYRVVLGREGDPRTLAVTYSERLGPDPVAVWRDDVEPGLKRAPGDYRRVGDIRATTYQGREAADMEWIAEDSHGSSRRTFGRGLLLGEGRGFSLRWTAPASEWQDAANQDALSTALRTFRRPSD